MSKSRPPSAMPRPVDAQRVARITARLQQGLAFHARGQLAEADTAYRDVLGVAPKHFDALHLSGVLRHQQGRHEEAVARIRQALAIASDSAEAHSNLGLALLALGRGDEALASFDRALERAPGSADLLFNRGNALRALGRPVDALDAYDRALAHRPDHVELLNNRSIVLHDLGRDTDALASSDRALAAKPDFAAAHNSRGMALRALGRFDEAVAGYDRASALQPRFVEALINRGNALLDLMKPDAAIEAYDQALAIDPRLVEALHRRGNAHRQRAKLDDALADYDRALDVQPDFIDALQDRGLTLQTMGRVDEAATAFARVVELAPEYPLARGRLLHARMSACDWTDFDRLTSTITAAIRGGSPVASPFAYQAVATSAADLHHCARLFGAATCPDVAFDRSTMARLPSSRIRIGYVSGEFRQQATALLATELFERHDRERFELVAFDNGWDDGSETRRRIDRAFDEIVVLRGLDDDAAARAIASRGIDILVNLNGYFGHGRQGVFARRAAPIQISFLGFPGTLGVDYIDYIVADAEVIPPGHDAHYDEKVIRLPCSYQVNPSRRPLATREPTRTACGLPDDAFVFCSFNASYKTTPEIFAVWMRLLRNVEGSVLWLLEDHAATSRNLRHEAAARGVTPERIVFAPRRELADHLARHACADLFLDTWPCNAHTTASDALWTGLPLVTCRGDTFPSRVASSLLHALDLRELVTDSLADYEALAQRLATTPPMREAIRARLVQARTTSPLFDPVRFSRRLETAYEILWQRHSRGDGPAAFDVEMSL